MSEKELDGYALFMLSERSPLYIKPLWQIHHEQKMAELKAQLEYNENPENIPTWASPELAFAMWCDRNKKRTTESFLCRLRLLLRRLCR